jgi:hypothetical protein
VAQIDVKQVVDFTGGLNFRADQFQLAANESPSMLNVEIDPRGGVFSRAGYQIKHSSPVVTPGTTWNPKGLFNYKYSNTPQIMLTTGKINSTDGKVYASSGGNFSALNVSSVAAMAVKSTNGASMTQWQDILYMAIGKDATTMYKWEAGDTYVTSLLASGPTWQPYQIPTGGYMPRAEIAITHANKMFVANTYEDGVAYPNRVRWSHENRPEDWYQQDYIDIMAGGEGVRGLQIVDGQLLIFKPKAIYLLMGYDADSFQLVELTTVLGIDYPQQAAAGNGGVFFFDYPNGLYFYNRNGIQDIFERIRPIIINGEVNSTYTKYITLSYIRNRVWISMPYQDIDVGQPPDYPSVNFIFDPTIGRTGAYTMFQSAPMLSDDATPSEIPGFGLVSGCEWRSSDDSPWYLMIHPDDDFPYVYYVDDYNNTVDDVLVGSTPSVTGNFRTQYTTSWFEDQAYVQLKTFIRPYYVFKEVSSTTQIKLNIYKNYNETVPQGGVKVITLSPTITGGTYSITGSGGVYGTAEYGVNTVGAAIKRRGIAPLGRGYAVQLEFNGPDDVTDSVLAPGRKWGINSIAYKFKRRKIRGN